MISEEHILEQRNAILADLDRNTKPEDLLIQMACETDCEAMRYLMLLCNSLILLRDRDRLEH
jgi:hypothetical protein